MKIKNGSIIKGLLIGTMFSAVANAAPVTLPVDIAEAGATWTDIESTEAGLNIDDAKIGVMSDAFDDFLVSSVNGFPYKPSNEADQSSVTANGETLGTALTMATQVVDGFNLSVQYLFFTNPVAGAPTVRMLMQIENPTATEKTAEVAIGGNLGSDEGTAVRASSSGDLSFTSSDSWMVSSDDATTLSDPTIAYNIEGPSCVIDRAVSAILLQDNLVSSYSITIGAGETKRIVVFTQLNTTNELAITAAATFNEISTINAANLFADLSDEIKATIANYGFTDCQADYRTLVNDAINKTKNLKLGKGGKAAKTAAKLADDYLADFSAELTLQAGQTENDLTTASRNAVNAVNQAVAAAKRSDSNFAALKTKAQRLLKKLINKIVAE